LGDFHQRQCRQSVKAFTNKLGERGRDAKSLESLRICAVGSATAVALERAGFSIDFVPTEFVAEAVAEGLRNLGIEGQRILLPRAEVAREILPIMLRDAGAYVEDVPVYRTVRARDTSGNLSRIFVDNSVDVVTFTSSSTVTNLLAALGEADGPVTGARLLDSTVNACIGPITAKTAREFGVQITVIAKEYTAKGLVGAIIDYYSGGGAE
jgi:uroporphyrinogen III methyltransferase/synthase